MDNRHSPFPYYEKILLYNRKGLFFIDQLFINFGIFQINSITGNIIISDFIYKYSDKVLHLWNDLEGIERKWIRRQ